MNESGSIWIVAALGISAVGCGGPLDADAIEARLVDFDTAGDFTRVNATSFPSQHQANTVNIWVSSEGLATYLGVDPDDTTDSVEAFPMDTMIVKEMLDEGGARAGLTVMVKGAQGGVPTTAGWWWGRFSADGTLEQGGRVQFCIDCHRDNELERTDWVRGVPMDNR
ncbi:MAG: cytochrome P460 family protein [Sandaracinaceae bacterium]